MGENTICFQEVCLASTYILLIYISYVFNWIKNVVLFYFSYHSNFYVPSTTYIIVDKQKFVLSQSFTYIQR